VSAAAGRSEADVLLSRPAGAALGAPARPRDPRRVQGMQALPQTDSPHRRNGRSRKFRRRAGAGRQPPVEDAERIDLAGMEATAERMAGGGERWCTSPGRQAVGARRDRGCGSPTSAAAVAALKKRGVGRRLLTGDNRATADESDRELGVTLVLAEVLPGQKAEQCERSRRRERKSAWSATASTMRRLHAGRRRIRVGAVPMWRWRAPTWC